MSITNDELARQLDQVREDLKELRAFVQGRADSKLAEIYGVV